MNAIGHVCTDECKPVSQGTNTCGVCIEEFQVGKGWVRISESYQAMCKAEAAMAEMADDGIDRRIYPAFITPVKKEKFNLLLFFFPFLFLFLRQP